MDYTHIKCPKCGNYTQSDFPYCNYCGAKLDLKNITIVSNKDKERKPVQATARDRKITVPPGYQLPRHIKCPKCGNYTQADFPYCNHCGAKLNLDNISIVSDKAEERQPVVQVTAPDIKNTAPTYYQSPQQIRCPQCGSTNIHFVSRTEGGGYNAAKGICAGLVCLPGFLCGLNKTTTITVRKCMNCGREF